jgi:hypothetical protein
MTKKGPYTLSGAKHILILAVINMFQGDMWIFAASDPTVVGTDLTTDKKRALITDSLPSPEISHLAPN